MDEKEFGQLFSAIMTQNVLLAKLILKMDTGRSPTDDEAFEYASEIYSKVRDGLVKIS